MKIGEVKATLHLKAHWEFHPKFPRLVSCFGAIRYNRPASIAVENFYFHENRCQEGPTFRMTVKQIIFNHVTVKTYDFLSDRPSLLSNGYRLHNLITFHQFPLLRMRGAMPSRPSFFVAGY
jgi:hypothetical protein